MPGYTRRNIYDISNWVLIQYEIYFFMGSDGGRRATDSKIFSNVIIIAELVVLNNSYFHRL